MNPLYIFCHLGIGDLFLCNGIIRHYAEINPERDIITFSREENIKNSMYMYRDNPKIKILAMPVPDMFKFVTTSRQFNEILIIGHDPTFYNAIDASNSFDKLFYKMAKIPHAYRWDKFYIERDIEREKNAYYNILNLTDGEKYIFVHDDIERNREFKPKFIEKGLKIIRPCDHKDISIYDFIYTVEHAEEVHVMNSSFSCMIDTMQLKCKNLYYHDYARTDMGPHGNHTLKLNWNFIKLSDITNPNPMIPVSLGELYDKISILIIKKERIKDPIKLENIQKELDLLQDIAEKYDIDGKFHTSLLDVNTKLWDVEDKLRIKEKNQETFGDFVDLARMVYKWNDLRAEIKKEINEKYSSTIVEEKSYEKY